MSNSIVSPAWLHENFKDPDILILDASQKGNKAGLTTDFEHLQIKGARLFDLKNTFSKKRGGLPNMLPDGDVFEQECRKLGINKSSKIVVYDNLGIYSSPRVWWMFHAMGHKNISVLNGGLPSWIKAGYETETLQDNPHGLGDFEAQYQAERVKQLEFVKNNLKDENAIVIDARSAGRFNGIAPEPRKGLKSGHIPNSVNIPFQQVLKNGQYKSKAELIKVFNEIKKDKRPLIFSCGSGLTACIVLLASELVLENHTAVYDGSWTEWAQINDLPIVGNKLL